MGSLSKPVRQYLERYAEQDAHASSQRVSKLRQFRYAIVIPVYDEVLDHLMTLVHRLAAQPDVLSLWIINIPSDAPQAARNRTACLLQQLPGNANTLLVDRVSHPIPKRQGVGLARKLGNDIALHLITSGQVQSPWIFQTDADATLPDNYFDVTLPARGAAVLQHRHYSADAQLQFAADLYDQHMRYYVAGLSYAGSSYAYPTLGSTLIVHAEDYAASRGYPRRNAGEDFYLLNKIAKLGGVTVLNHAPILLQARQSSRVPFGTGPALTEIVRLLARDPSGETYTSYDPRSFELLRRTLHALKQFACDQTLPPAPMDALLTQIGFNKVATAIATRYATQSRREQALEQWFDAFKTLRFIHQARHIYPDVALLPSLRTLPAGFPVTEITNMTLDTGLSDLG